MTNRCRRYFDVQRTIQAKAASASNQLDGDRPPIGNAVDRSPSDGLRARTRVLLQKSSKFAQSMAYENHPSDSNTLRGQPKHGSETEPCHAPASLR